MYIYCTHYYCIILLTINCEKVERKCDYFIISCHVANYYENYLQRYFDLLLNSSYIVNESE